MIAGNRRMIIDECVTFYLAGTATTAMASGNLIMYMTRKPYRHYFKQARDEIREIIVDPYLKENPHVTDITDALAHSIDYHNISELRLYHNLF